MLLIWPMHGYQLQLEDNKLPCWIFCLVVVCPRVEGKQSNAAASLIYQHIIRENLLNVM